MRVSPCVRWRVSLRVYMITTISFISRASLSLVSLCKCACESELVSSQVQLRSRVFIDKNQDASFSLRKATINMHLDVFTFQSCVRARLCQKLGGSKDLRHHAGNQMFTLNDHIGSLNLTFFLTSARLVSNMCLNCQTAAFLK